MIRDLDYLLLSLLRQVPIASFTEFRSYIATMLKRLLLIERETKGHPRLSIRESTSHKFPGARRLTRRLARHSAD